MLFLSGCATDDPEAALRELVDSAEQAAEARDTGYFRDLIGASFVDNRGNDRGRVIDWLRAYFLANQRIEVVTRLQSIELRGSDAAEVVVLAGVLGRRQDQGLLQGLDGRLYRLELELVSSDGDWQIIGARWEQSFEALTGD